LAALLLLCGEPPNRPEGGRTGRVDVPVELPLEKPPGEGKEIPPIEGGNPPDGGESPPDGGESPFTVPTPLLPGWIPGSLTDMGWLLWYR